MSLVRNSLLTLIGTVSRVVLSMAGQIIISRVLGPGGKGLYAFLVQIPTVLVPLSSLGLNYANTYYIAKDKEDGPKAAGNATVLALILGALMSLGVGLSYLVLRQGYMQAVSLSQLQLMVLVIPFGLLNLYWLSIVWGLNRIAKYNIGLMIQYVVVAVGVAALGAVHRLTVTNAFAIWVLGNVLTSLYFLPDMLKLSNWRIFVLDLSYVRKTLGFGLKSYAANVMMIINYRLDVFIITGFLPLTQVGLYTTAVALAEMVGYVGNAVNTALIPKLASGEDALTFESTPKVLRLTLFLTFLAALALALTAYPLIWLFFGVRFLGSFYPLLLLLPGVIALGGATVISGDLMARGKPVYNSIATGVSVVLTIILDFSLIPLWGIKGASIASSLVYIALFTLNFCFLKRESGYGLAQILILTREDASEMFSYARTIFYQIMTSRGGTRS